jgi:Predicted membrane protein
MKSTEERLARIENRLAQLEYRIQLMSKGEPEAKPVQASAPPPEIIETPLPSVYRFADPQFVSARKHGSDALTITQILGWTGATALVLAAAYLIRLALDAGWLTPQRQLGLAVVSGFSLIGAGLWLRSSDRQYASLLPAGGLVVLFLSIYGAHLYYHFIGMHVAAGAVVLTCLAALWLGRLFESELYGLFAVLGSYSAPFLLHTLAGSVTDLVVYFSAWSLLFCVYSIWIGNRRPYLLAAYLALLGFHFLWKQMAPDEWVAAFAFQAIQFLIFIAGAIGFSIRNERPMDRDVSLAHLPLLLIFYALQYSLLQRHLPAMAPWIALGSAGVLLLAYLFAEKAMKQPLESGKFLVGAYAALALFHAGYMELLPDAFAPWAALLLLPALGICLTAGRSLASIGWPLRLLLLVVFAINYLRVTIDADTRSVPAHDLLALCYAAELYVAYYLARRMPDMRGFAAPALYVGHVALMSAAVQILDGRLAVSFAWGFIALACLALAFKYRDAVLGKSSLLVFAASGAKVLLFDLSGATPLVRIGSLVILGVTLYAGGWMYRKIDLLETEKS